MSDDLDAIAEQHRPLSAHDDYCYQCGEEQGWPCGVARLVARVRAAEAERDEARSDYEAVTISLEPEHRLRTIHVLRKELAAAEAELAVLRPLRERAEQVAANVDGDYSYGTAAVAARFILGVDPAPDSPRTMLVVDEVRNFTEADYENAQEVFKRRATSTEDAP